MLKIINGEGKKMFTLTYAQIRDPEFNPILMKLVHTKLKLSVAKKVLKLLKVIRDEQIKSDGIWRDLSDKYLEVVNDESGNPQGLRIKAALSEEEKVVAGDELSAFVATVIEFDTPKLKADELHAVEFTPADLMRIQDIID